MLGEFTAFFAVRYSEHQIYINIAAGRGKKKTQHMAFSAVMSGRPVRIENGSENSISSTSSHETLSTTSNHSSVISPEDPPSAASSSSNPSSPTHKKRATKGRVFQCTGYPGCLMLFTRSEHLARHKRKHTGERPFTCPYCLKNFSRLDNLRQHKQTVHAYETYLKGSNQIVHPDPQTPFSQMPMILPPNLQLPAWTTVTPLHSAQPLRSSAQTPLHSTQPINSSLHTSIHSTPIRHNSHAPHSQLLGSGAHLPMMHLQMAQPMTHGMAQPMAQPYYPYMYPYAPMQSAVHTDLKAPPQPFKPKRRPRPLALDHLHLAVTDIQTAPAHTTQFAVPGRPLVSGPLLAGPVAMPLTGMGSTTANSRVGSPRAVSPSASGSRSPGANSSSVGSPENGHTNGQGSDAGATSAHPPHLRGVSLTPNLVSPLLPLFHQSFSQTTIRTRQLGLQHVQEREPPKREVTLPGVKSILEKSEGLSEPVSKKPTINLLLSPYETKFPRTEEKSARSS